MRATCRRWHVICAVIAVVGSHAPDLHAQASVAPRPWTGERIAKPTLVVDTWQPGEFFGKLHCIVALPGGGVAAYDAASSVGAQIFEFDRSGKLTRRIGRSGSGPGEYGSQVIDDCLTLTHEKGVALHDLAGSRLVIWDGNGQLLRHVRLPVRLSGSSPYVAWQDGGGVLVKTQVRRSRPGMMLDPLAYAMFKLDSTGNIRDTLPFQMPSNPAAGSINGFGPANFSFVLGDESRLLATSAAVKFTIVDPRGRATVHGRPFTPVKLGAAERAELLRVTAWNEKVSRGAMKDEGVGSTKPAISHVQVAPDGNIWIRARVPSVRGAPRRIFGGPELPGEPQETFREPPVFEIFGPRGDYIGRLRLADPGAIPLRFSMSGLSVWCAGTRSYNGSVCETRCPQPRHARAGAFCHGPRYLGARRSTVRPTRNGITLHRIRRGSARTA